MLLVGVLVSNNIFNYIYLLEKGKRMKSRSRKFMLNGMLSFMLQIVTMICGLILPRMILLRFGSTINGTISSISQFLGFITLLQGGVGTVARYAFYKPLANQDFNAISVAYKTVSDFYRKFAVIFIAYMFILSLIYPIFSHTKLNYWHVSSLVVIIGFASVFEFFFGQASLNLLFSAQKGYIYSVIQIICILFSTVISIILLKLGCSIQLIKLGGSFMFLIRPIAMYLIVKKWMKLKKDVIPDKSILAQKNAAFVRHIAFYIHTSTDVMVLTLFSNVLWVSVYTVHYYVTGSLSNLVSSILGNTEAVYGDIIAHNDKKELSRSIPIYDLLSKFITCICFFTCMTLISQFISIYTANVNDINYYQPLFAILLVISELIYCMGLTYQNIYIAAGHINKTQWIAVGEAVINLIVSILLVWKFGIVGVTIGTVLAMIYKSFANIIYMKKNVINISWHFIIKSYLVNIIPGSILTILFWTLWYHKIYNFLMFFAYAFFVFCIISATTFVLNMVVFRKEVLDLLAILIKKRKKPILSKRRC